MQQDVTTLENGQRLAFRRWQASPASGDVVLMAHGAESHAGWFVELGRAFSAKNLPGVAWDRGGSGASEGGRGRLRSAAAAVSELRAVAATLAPGYERIHLLGMSWGGLLAAYTASLHPALFASVTLVAPAIFPLQLPAPVAVLRAILSGGRRLVPLAYAPKDFCRSTQLQAFIVADAAKNTAVGLDFLQSTYALSMAVRRRSWQAKASKVQVLLAGTDTIIDNVRTQKWAVRHGLPVIMFPQAYHSLILEDPVGVAQAVWQLARGNGVKNTQGRAHGD